MDSQYIIASREGDKFKPHMPHKGVMEYRKVSVESGLVADVKVFVAEPHSGYRSTSEFVHEAIRIRLQELRKASP